MKLLHQCGHNSNWNIQAFEGETMGDGLVISPVHQALHRVEGITASTCNRSLFDPQFYLPNSQKAKLHSYKFFPEVLTQGFSTIDFSLFALESAKLCIEFQARLNFERIIIPARFFEQMVSDFIQKQEIYSVVPFLKETSRQRIKRPVLLTLPLTSHMVEDAAFRTRILNWVTSYPEISGVYLIVDHERPEKQVTSDRFLFDMLVLLTELREAGLDVVLGYTNTESLLYLVAGEIDITMGAFENTRMFSLDKFIESDEDRRGPKARIYLPGLLNWIQFGQAKELRAASKEIWDAVYEPTDYSEAALKQAVEPTFNQAPLYKHYFKCFSNQVEQLRNLSREERFRVLSGWLKMAIQQHQEIEALPLVFERHGKGDFLQSWQTALNKYFRAYLKG